MQKRSVLTIDDLVRFCKEHNFTQFRTKDAGHGIHVQVPCESFESVPSDDPLMLYGNARLMHTGVNNNLSNLTEEGAKSCLSKIAYKPILADFTEVNGERDFTSHAIEFNDDGTRTYIEKQVGCFTADKPYMEQDPQNPDRKYIFAKIAIPRSYTDAAEIIERKGGTKISAELCVNDMSYSVDEGLLLNDVEVMGCCLLGVDPDSGRPIHEGMEGAYLQIEDFSADNNSVINKSELIDEITAAVFERLSNKTAFAENSEKGGRPKEMDKLNELLAKYEKTIEDIMFVYDGMTDEELEAAFANAFDTENNGVVAENVFEDAGENEGIVGGVIENAAEGGEQEPELKPEFSAENEPETSLDDNKKSFSVNGVTFEVSLSEIQYALYELVNSSYSESDNDYYSVEVYEGSKTIVMSGMFSGRSYRQGYKVRNDVYSLVGSRVPVKAVFVTADEEAELDRMRSNYAAMSDKLAKYESEPEKMNVLNSLDYACISDQADFVELMKPENHFDFTVDELKEHVDEMLLQYAKSGKLNFAETKHNKKSMNKGDLFMSSNMDGKSKFLDGLLNKRN